MKQPRHLVQQRGEEPRQAHISRSPSDLDVKILVVSQKLKILPDVRTFIRSTAQALQQISVDAAGGSSRCSRLQQESELKNVLDGLRGDRRNDVSPTGAN